MDSLSVISAHRTRLCVSVCYQGKISFLGIIDLGTGSAFEALYWGKFLIVILPRFSIVFVAAFRDMRKLYGYN